MEKDYNFSIKSVSGNRFHIYSKDGTKKLDDANGYGYKTKQNAFKAGLYKYGGMKKTIDANKKNAIAFWDQHKDIRDWLDAEMFYALKDRETLSDDDIVKSIEELFGVVINKAWIKHS